MKESAIQSKILKWLESIGAVCNKTIGMSKAGWPDIICCFKGRFIGVEVKRPGLKPTPLQEYKINELNEAGGIAGAATSVEETKELIKELL